MLALAKPRMENGDWDSGHEEDEEGEDLLDGPKPNHLDILRHSADMDLAGSFSARDRRRGKQVYNQYLTVNIYKYTDKCSTIYSRLL